MERINLYIDFDGVILDTITPLYKDYSDQRISDENKEAFYVNYPWENIIDDKYIINDAIGDIKKIIDSNKFNLAILTHVNSIKEAVLKIEYLRKYFKDITIIPCPKQISKTKMIHTEGSVLIDDYVGNLKEWKAEGGIGIKFDTKKEHKEFQTIKDLKEVLSMF